jgi:hypothetical protein
MHGPGGQFLAGTKNYIIFLNRTSEAYIYFDK